MRHGLSHLLTICPVTHQEATLELLPSISMGSTASLSLCYSQMASVLIDCPCSAWCGDASFASAHAGTHGSFAGYNVPAYFSEFGCVVAGSTRTWTEVESLFSSQMSDVFSGGLAFSYFPAASAAGQFGMVTVSGTTVTPNADFEALATEYGRATPPNTPSLSAAGTTRYPACSPANSTFLASTTLPPTPNNAACQCLESVLSCTFRPSIANYSIVVGPLLDTACGLLEGRGGSCADIGGNGTTGSYGRVSACDASQSTFCTFDGLS